MGIHAPSLSCNMPAVDSTYGPLLVGSLITALLAGVTNVQVFTFFFVNPKDPVGHKFAVLSLWFLDVSHFVAVAITLYKDLIVNYNGTMVFLPRVLWSCKFLFLLEALTIGVAQILYTIRLWQLSCKTHRVATMFLTLTVLTAFGFALFTTSRVFHLGDGDSMATIFGPALACLILTGVADVGIAVALIWALREYEAAMQWTDSAVVALTSYALNSGSITGVFSVACIVTFAVSPTTSIFLGIRVFLTSLHVLSFVAMLNARHYFERKGHPSTLILQAHEASLRISKLGAIEAIPNDPRLCEKTRTINGAGLPLFKVVGNDSDSQVSQIRAVEVAVSKERSCNAV